MQSKLKVIIVTLCFGGALHPPLNHAAVILGPVTNVTNGHHYYLLSSSSWPTSEAEAISLGGHLATISDAAENSWVVSTFETAPGLWIGLSDSVIEGTFMWADGTPVTYTNWELYNPTGNPDEPRQDFVLILRQDLPGFTGGTWVDSDPDNNSYSGFNPVHGVVEIVPEPSTVALMLPASLILATFRRRRICPPGALSWSQH